MMKQMIIKTMDGAVKIEENLQPIPRIGEFIEMSKEYLAKNNNGIGIRYKNHGHRFEIINIIHTIKKSITIIIK